MLYKLKLIRGRSYTGHGIKATTKSHFVETNDKNIADYLVKCKRFELVEVVGDGEPNKTDNIPDGELSDKWTVAQLRDYATANNIDLAGASLKPDILTKIKEAESENDVDFGEEE